jgi:hypothetical protein
LFGENEQPDGRVQAIATQARYQTGIASNRFEPIELPKLHQTRNAVSPLRKHVASGYRHKLPRTFIRKSLTNTESQAAISARIASEASR